MGKVTLPEEVKAQIDVTVKFDDNNQPAEAVGQKELQDGEEAPVADGEPNKLTISDDAKAKFAAAIETAQKNYEQAKSDAVSALEAQLVSENYTDGVFNTPAQ